MVCFLPPTERIVFRSERFLLRSTIFSGCAINGYSVKLITKESQAFSNFISFFVSQKYYLQLISKTITSFNT